MTALTSDTLPIDNAPVDSTVAFSVVEVALGDRSYPIFIGPGILENWPELPLEALPGEVAVFSNHSLAHSYANPLAARLEARGQRVTRFDMGDGEQYKSLASAENAFDALAGANFSRRGAVWAVGGGVTGDLSGFVAATWMRGVSFVQVPTTLLAMVDSSVGGKTGVNHPKAKNLLGAFWQPVAVLIDPRCLRTLPIRELRAGLAEVIKYGVIADAEFFGWLEDHIEALLQVDAEALQHVITRSCQIKAEVVGQDERESDSVGRRAALNYGHTVGHALEAVMTYGELLHGEAIAIGMTVAARLAIAQGTIAPDEGQILLERQTRLFERAGLPTQAPEGLDWDALQGAMALDKKNQGRGVNFILPTRIGEVVMARDVDLEAVRAALFAS